MIVEAVFNLLASAVEVIFGWISLPAFPADLEQTLETFEDLIFTNLSVLGFFVRISTLKTIVPFMVLLLNFDKAYALVMWIVRKLPLGID